MANKLIPLPHLRGHWPVLLFLYIWSETELGKKPLGCLGHLQGAAGRTTLCGTNISPVKNLPGVPKVIVPNTNCVKAHYTQLYTIYQPTVLCDSPQASVHWIGSVEKHHPALCPEIVIKYREHSHLCRPAFCLWSSISRLNRKQLCCSCLSNTLTAIMCTSCMYQLESYSSLKSCHVSYNTADMIWLYSQVHTGLYYLILQWCFGNVGNTVYTRHKLKHCWRHSKITIIINGKFIVKLELRVVSPLRNNEMAYKPIIAQAWSMNIL